jgi:hypothetical protein
MPELRLPSSLGYQCRAADCGRSYSREEALVSDQRPPLCPGCNSFLERVWVDPQGRTVLGAAGGAAFGLAVAGPVGLIAGGVLGGLAASRSEGLRQSIGALGGGSQPRLPASSASPPRMRTSETSSKARAGIPILRGKSSTGPRTSHSLNAGRPRCDRGSSAQRS